MCSENFADDDYSGHKNWKQLEPSPEKIPQDNQNCDPSYLNSEFKCVVCQKVHSSKPRIMAHKMSHTGAKPFCCVTCGNNYATQDSLKQHLKKHEEGWTGYSKPRQCNECGKRFGKSSRLKDHKITHKKIEPYQCDKCGNISQDTKYLTSPIKTVHTNQPSSCPHRSIHFERGYSQELFL